MNASALHVLRFGCVFLFTALPNAFGQFRQNMYVDLPFAFEVNGAQFPPGEYTVSSSPVDPVVKLRSTDHKRSVLSLTNTKISRHMNSEGKLIFHRYGERYFLSEIWTPDTNTGRNFPMRGAESELARRVPSTGGETVTVSLRSPRKP